MVTSRDGEYDEDGLAVEKDDPVEEEDTGSVPTRWSWLDLATITLCLARNTCQVVAGYFDAVAHQVQDHTVYRATHVDFADDVMRDIDRL